MIIIEKICQVLVVMINMNQINIQVIIKIWIKQSKLIMCNMEMDSMNLLVITKIRVLIINQQIVLL